MPIELILLGLSPVFVLLIAYEWWRHPHLYKLKDSLANTALALMHQASDALALVLLMPLFYVLHSYSLWQIELSITSLVVAFVVQDFLYYWFHRASHNIHWMWAAHVVHHSSTRMNFSTAFRQSLMYPVAGMWLFWTPMMIIGFDPNIVLMVVALNLAYQFFVHTQLVGKLGFLEKIFNTPSVHRVHHSINAQYIDRNYAGVLVIWDRMFGTYTEEDEQDPCQYGIRGQIHSHNPIYISFHQWRHLGQAFFDEKGLTNKLKVLFGYPTTDHRDSVG